MEFAGESPILYALSDYDDFVYVDGDEITPFVPQVKALMMKIINIAK